MATKSIATKSRRNVVASPVTGPVRATQSFGLHTTNGLSRVVDHNNVLPQNVVRPTSCDSRRSSPSDDSNVLRKVKKGSSSSNAISRSSSLDAVSSNFYLNGTWPRVGHVQHASSHHIEDVVDADKETQTLKDWRVERFRSSPGAFLSHSTRGTSDDLKEIRARLKTTKDASSLRSSPVLPFVVSSSAAGLPTKNTTNSIKYQRHRHRKHSVPHSRGSLEGLNQDVSDSELAVKDDKRLLMRLFNLTWFLHEKELETLEIANISVNESDKHDGRRAPVLDLLTLELGTDTFKQTTTGDECFLTQIDYSSVFSFEPSDSGFSSAISLTSPAYDLPTPNSCREEPEDTQLMEEYGVSPPKFILTRLPPEGCENVVCKPNESSYSVQMEVDAIDSEVVEPPFLKCHIPSPSSAFYSPLFRKYLSQATEMLADMTTGHDRVVCMNNAE